MSQTFAKLFEASQFAKVAPSKRVFPFMKQTYVAKTKQQALQGDFGLKYDVPLKLRRGAVVVNTFDTPFGFARIDDRKIDIGWFTNLLEQFTKPKESSQTQSSALISNISDSKFQLYLGEARIHAQDLKRKILGSPNDGVKIDLIASHLGLQLNDQSSYQTDLELRERDVVLKPLLDEAPEVKGCILSVINDGFVVGIGGFCAFLPNTPPHFVLSADFKSQDRCYLQTFYVHEIRFKHDTGRLEVTLSMQKNHVAPQKAHTAHVTEDIDLDSLLAGFNLEDTSAEDLAGADQVATDENKDFLSSLESFLDDVQGEKNQKK